METSKRSASHNSIPTMSDEFNVPGGDIILRTQGSPNRDFKVHRLVLSLASPVFRDMFSIPQPRSNDLLDVGIVEVIDVADSPQALDLILRLIYPFPSPKVDSLELLVEGLIIADKYDIDGARGRLRESLNKFAQEAPLRAYAVASRFGLDEEMNTIAPFTTCINLPSLTNLPDDFDYVPAKAYHKLVVFHAQYRTEIEAIIHSVPLHLNCAVCISDGLFLRRWIKMRLVEVVCQGVPTTVSACVQDLGNSCNGICITKFVGDVVVRLGSKSRVIRP